MINLHDGELVDMLPSQMATQTQQRCISYALKKGIRLIIERANMTRTVAVIDSLPEQILDMLAVEMRTPYYREEMEKENADVASDSRYSRSGGRAGRCRIRRRGSERVV